MALAAEYEEVKAKKVVGNGPRAGNSYIPFFSSSAEEPKLPDALLNQYDAGRISPVHFHIHDQFQVVIGGRGTRGRHELAPYGVHFARAFTPYGPIVADATEGVTFLALRTRFDPGSQRLSKELDQLKSVPNREPWQRSQAVMFAAPQLSQGEPDVALHALPSMEDGRGLAAYTLRMKPGVSATAPDPSHSDGQYLVALKGSVFLESAQHKKALALIFVSPTEGPLEIQAGSDGLAALILNFPLRHAPQATVKEMTAENCAFERWRCPFCAFIYDEAVGLAEDGVPPGTRWREVPDTWSCPDCSASKSDFKFATPDGIGI